MSNLTCISYRYKVGNRVSARRLQQSLIKMKLSELMLRISNTFVQVVWKNQLVVFGGFYDSLRETRYFNDVHLLNLQTLKWSKANLLPHSLVSSMQATYYSVPLIISPRR